MVEAIIISGGNIQRGFALDFLEEKIKKSKEKPLLIAADHGLDFFKGTELVPDIAIGDFDSLTEEGLKYMEQIPNMEIIRLRPDKDDSDTQSAVNLAMQRGIKKISLLGATGTRLDHVMANFGLLAYGIEKGISIEIVDPNNRICVIKSGTILKKAEGFGKYVSFFPLGEKVQGLSLKGFKYELENYDLKASDSGLTVSNEFQDETAEVTYQSGLLLMIMSGD